MAECDFNVTEDKNILQMLMCGPADCIRKLRKEIGSLPESIWVHQHLGDKHTYQEESADIGEIEDAELTLND